MLFTWPCVLTQPGLGAGDPLTELLASLEEKLARQWSQDDVVWTGALPMGSTDRIRKNALRDVNRIACQPPDQDNP